MLRKAYIVLIVLVLSGCSANSPEELDRLTKEDPAFKQMIATRDQVHEQINLIRQDLLSRKKTLDAQIEKLRGDYDNYAKAQNKKIDQYQSVIDTQKSVLRHEIETASAQLDSKTAELGGYEKTLSDVKKVLHESKGITFSSQEKQKWEERVLMLNEKIRPLADEIQELKLQIRLKKQKIGFLK